MSHPVFRPNLTLFHRKRKTILVDNAVSCLAVPRQKKVFRTSIVHVVGVRIC